MVIPPLYLFYSLSTSLSPHPEHYYKSSHATILFSPTSIFLVFLLTRQPTETTATQSRTLTPLHFPFFLLLFSFVSSSPLPFPFATFSPLDCHFILIPLPPSTYFCCHRLILLFFFFYYFFPLNATITPPPSNNRTKTTAPHHHTSMLGSTHNCNNQLVPQQGLSFPLFFLFVIYLFSYLSLFLFS